MTKKDAKRKVCKKLPDISILVPRHSVQLNLLTFCIPLHSNCKAVSSLKYRNFYLIFFVSTMLDKLLLRSFLPSDLLINRYKLSVYPNTWLLIDFDN